MLRRLKEEPRPFRFLLSRCLWHSGAGRWLTFAFADDLRIRFHPSAVSASLWVDRGFNSPDRDVLRAHLRPGGVFVDVGSNIGVLTLIAAKQVGRGGRVYAIEPHPVIYRYLLDNVALNGLDNIIAFNCALGAEQRLIAISDKRSDDQNAIVASSPLSVPMRRLDEVVPADERVDLLKIDVEGFELFVLSGAKETLKRTSCVYIEVWDERSQHFGYRARDVAAVLRDAGFRLFRVTDSVEHLSDDDIGRSCENVLALHDPDAASAPISEGPNQVGITSIARVSDETERTDP